MKHLLSGNAIGKAIEWLKCRIGLTSCNKLPMALSEYKPIRLKPLVEALIDKFTLLTEQNNLVFVGMFNGTDVTVLGDEKRITDIINHLLNSSIRYTPVEYIILHVEYLSNKVSICVADNGIGVDEPAATGRGMSEVRDIVSSLRGTVDVISDGGKGCKVIVKVPMKKC